MKGDTDGKTPSGPHEPDDETLSRAEEEALEREDAEVKDLLSVLKRSGEASGEGDLPNLLPGVQRKIRQRSRGKFYGDGWSVGKTSTSTYIVTSLIMLVILVVVYFALMPAGLLKTP